jgi:hypothetical protein
VVGNLRITTDNGGARATALAPPKSLSLLPSEAEIPPRACLLPSLPRANPPSPPRLPLLLPPTNPSPALSAPVLARAGASNSIAWSPGPLGGSAAAAPASPPPEAAASTKIKYILRDVNF